MDWGVQHIVTPQGDVLVVMSLAQFQRMSAAADPVLPDEIEIGPASLASDLARSGLLGSGLLGSEMLGPELPASERPVAGLSHSALSDIGHSLPREVRRSIEQGESPLAAWRKYRDISQSQLARVAGVSRFTVMRMEASGAGAGNRQSRQLLASALGIPVSAL